MPDPENQIDGQEVHRQQAFSLEGGRLWIAVVLAILIAASGYSLLRLSSEEQHRAELLRSNQALQASLDQAKSQLQAASDQLNAANARAQAAQFQPPAPQQSASIPSNAPENPVLDRPIHRTRIASGNRRASSARNAPRNSNDPRWSAMDAKLADQQKQIESTRSDMEKTRQDLDSRIGSTRDELNGAIAKTSDEVAQLRKRGERNYYEFNLNKSSQFERTGPVSLSLRKSNVKHKYYDIALIVDDQKIEKKHVNLYEPMWISVPDRPEPVQLVVNSISKDNVKGYLSEPRYKRSELAGTESAKVSTRTLNAPAANASQPEHDSDTGAGTPLQPR